MVLCSLKRSYIITTPEQCGVVLTEKELYYNHTRTAWCCAHCEGVIQGVQPNFSKKCGNVGMAMKMWEFFFNVGIVEKM